MSAAGRSLLALAGFLAVACASTAQAGPTGQTVRYMAPGISKCLISRGAGFVPAWLSTLPGSNEEVETLKRGQITTDSCFGINSDGSRFRSTYDYDRIRAALVRFILQSDRNLIPVEPPSGLANAEWYYLDVNTSESRNRAGMVANEIGFCLARRNWSGVRAIVFAVDPKNEHRYDLLTNVVEQELRIVNSELRKFVDELPNCVPAGMKVSLTRTKLRNLLEETALHAMGEAIMPDAKTALAAGSQHA